MQRWVERSEARWALWAGIVGALATAALSTKMILSQGSSSAGLGFVFLPLVAAAAILPEGRRGEIDGLADSKLLTLDAKTGALNTRFGDNGVVTLDKSPTSPSIVSRKTRGNPKALGT